MCCTLVSWLPGGPPIFDPVEFKRRVAFDSQDRSRRAGRRPSPVVRWVPCGENEDDCRFLIADVQEPLGGQIVRAGPSLKASLARGASQNRQRRC